MGTSDNTFDFASDRHARNGILAASVVIFISSVSLSSLLAPAVIGQDFPLITIIEMIVIFGQILSAVSAWILISRGDVELGALRQAERIHVFAYSHGVAGRQLEEVAPKGLCPLQR